MGDMGLGVAVGAAEGAGFPIGGPVIGALLLALGISIPKPGTAKDKQSAYNKGLEVGKDLARG
jgi:hypothetical protein